MSWEFEVSQCDSEVEQSVAHLDSCLDWRRSHDKSRFGLLHEGQWTPVRRASVPAEMGFVEDYRKILPPKESRAGLGIVNQLFPWKRPRKVSLFLVIGLLVQIPELCEKSLQ